MRSPERKGEGGSRFRQLTKDIKREQILTDKVKNKIIVETRKSPKHGIRYLEKLVSKHSLDMDKELKELDPKTRAKVVGKKINANARIKFLITALIHKEFEDYFKKVVDVAMKPTRFRLRKIESTVNKSDTTLIGVYHSFGGNTVNATKKRLSAYFKRGHMLVGKYEDAIKNADVIVHESGIIMNRVMPVYSEKPHYLVDVSFADRKKLPTEMKTLTSDISMDYRDALMAEMIHKISKLHEGKKIVGVFGYGHLKGINQMLKNSTKRKEVLEKYTPSSMKKTISKPVKSNEKPMSPHCVLLGSIKEEESSVTDCITLVNNSTTLGVTNQKSFSEELVKLRRRKKALSKIAIELGPHTILGMVLGQTRPDLTDFHKMDLEILQKNCESPRFNFLMQSLSPEFNQVYEKATLKLQKEVDVLPKRLKKKK